jgi:hypothetical protein
MTPMKKAILFVVCSLVIAGVGRTSVRAGELPSLSASLPDGAIGFVEISQLGDVVRRLPGSPLMDLVRASNGYRQFERSPEFGKLRTARVIVEFVLGGTLWKAAANMFDGNVALALYPNAGDPKKPQAVAMIRSPFSGTRLRFRMVLRPLLWLFAPKVDTGELCPGARAWGEYGKLLLSLHKDWLLATPRRELLDRTLKVIASKEKAGSLAMQVGVPEMEEGLGTGHHVRAYLNTAMISEGTGERFGMPRQLDNGIVSLLFDGLLELAGKSPFAGATLDIREQGFELVAAVSGDPSTLSEPYGLYFSHPPESGVIDLPDTEGMIAGLTIHRKLGEWYRGRDRLLAEQLLPAFDKFETDIGNLLPQKDFGEDVLPLLGDNFTLVAALQNFEHLDGAPGVKLPAFAAIFDLAKPAEGADIFQLFFQTLSSVINIQAGQEGRQPWLMEVEFHNETKISYARYLEKPKGERLPIVFNFQPAAAGVGRKYILASSVQLCRDLVDYFKDPASSAWQARNVDFHLDFGNLAVFAKANEAFLRSQEIQKGTPAEDAARNIGMLVEGLKRMDALRYHTGAEGGLFKLHLEGRWK